MKLVTLRDHVERAAGIWRDKYGTNSGHYGKLLALDTATATPAEIKAITTGYNPGWFDDGLTCNECGRVFLSIVEVGIDWEQIEDGDVIGRMVNRLCSNCLAEALSLASQGLPLDNAND
jgi:hypothetical protein